MTKGRLEAFSDAVIAILMTIMVLDLRAPRSPNLSELQALEPVFACYTLSFVFLGIYWNNHHHLVHSVQRVSGGVLWANLHLLFWLSLIPFVTDWMALNKFSDGPVAVYGVVLLFAGIAFSILTSALVRAEGPHSRVAQALGRDVKGKASIAIYGVAIGVSFVAPYVSCALYGAVALMWLVPDRRFETDEIRRE